MTFTQIGYFLQVARTLNITEAAVQLHMTQPTLSRQITAIEAELNLPLFIRGRKHLRLTPAGKVLKEELTELMERYERGLERAKRAGHGLSGSLRLGVLDGYNVSDILPPVIGHLEKNYPGVKLYLQRGSFVELLNLLYERKLDAIISYEFHIGHKEDLERITLEEVRPVLAIPKQHPLAQKEQLSVFDLRDETLVIFSEKESPGGVQLIRDTCRAAGGVTPRFHFVDSMEDSALWVEAGVRCALFNSGMLIAHNPHIKVLEIPELPPMKVLLGWCRSNENEALPLLTEFFANRE